MMYVWYWCVNYVWVCVVCMCVLHPFCIPSQRITPGGLTPLGLPLSAADSFCNKNTCSSKVTMKSVKIWATDENIIFANQTLVSRIDKELSTLNYEKKDPVFKWAKDLYKLFTNVDLWVTSELVERWLASLNIRGSGEKQKVPLYTVRVATIEKTNNTHNTCQWSWGETGSLPHS